MTTNQKDAEYAARFWSHGQPDGLEEAMRENIILAESSGFLSIFVSQERMTEDDREKLSAYRMLAQQMEYEVGSFSFNKEACTALASIKKISI